MAGLIPDNFVQDLLARSDLVELIRQRVQLKKSGRDYMGCCPFHQEKTPSFSVSPDKQFYYCFGCGAKGDALRFLMEYDHLNFPQAVEQLAAQAGMEVPREEESPQQRQQRSLNQQIYELLERAERFFQNQLASAAERQKAHSYLKQRGLSQAICDEFRLGYAPPGYDNLPTGLSLDKEQNQLALTAGLLSENDQGRRYDKFRDRLIFPIRDARGRTIGFGGRVFGDGKPKYLNSPETPVFHKGQELYGLWEWRQTRQADNQLLVVEGYMDVISLAQFGIRNVVATLGTATSELHMQKLFREVDEVIFCFDGDKAGRRAAWRAMESALGALADGKTVRFLFLPDDEDPDTLVREQGPEAIRAACEKAQPLDDFLFNQLSQGLDLSDVAAKAKLARDALPFIARLKGDFYRSLLEKALCERTGLALDELQRLRSSQAANNKPSTPSQHTKSAVTSAPDHTPPPTHEPLPGHRLHLSERLLLLLLNHPKLASELPPGKELDELPLPGLGLLKEAILALKRQPVSNSAQALGLFMSLSQGERLQRLLTTRLAASDWPVAKREWQGGLLQLQLMQLDKQLEQERCATSPDMALLQSLLQKRQQLQKERSLLGAPRDA